MGRRKQSRYTAAEDCPLLIQSGKDFFTSCKGRWREEYFHNNNPIVLELACGRGEYTVGLSQVYPDKNFIGVDIKAERMMVGIQSYQSLTSPSFPLLSERDDHKVSLTSLSSGEEGPSPSGRGVGVRLAFLRTIIHHIDQFFAAGEIDEIWIVHPDPRPKNRDIKRRLTSPRFLSMYYSLLSDEGLLRLKTDDGDLFAYSLDIIQQDKRRELQDMTHDLYTSPLLAEHHGIKTHYEMMFVEQGRTIHYGVWRKE